MKKRTKAFLKQSLAVLMSLSMTFGPCAPGIAPVFAAKKAAVISVEDSDAVSEEVIASEDAAASEEILASEDAVIDDVRVA